MGRGEICCPSEVRTFSARRRFDLSCSEDYGISRRCHDTTWWRERPYRGHEYPRIRVSRGGMQASGPRLVLII